jgi:hypothetical protein
MELEENMKRALCIGLMWASVALASDGKHSVQECKKSCDKMQKSCTDACKEHLKKSKKPDEQQCAPGCKKAVTACKEGCVKQSKRR